MYTMCEVYMPCGVRALWCTGLRLWRHDADNESEWSLLNLVEGSDDESESKVDLEDYQEYLEKHHKSASESSGESD
ncbi:hypothetical protein F2Q70_00018379 [Brassica cretica]|uniref:Uncharacterized protein n=1 Tax=Brassica cretica TaxID=69181 RepID=A0A8S9KZ81_BRACR|nr:hypothetical protein F2Q70_00018379 [Brassica cretica]KAF2598623.1 hypothetical protein F2Q68_00011643 [Brassica cretica]